MRNFFTKLFLFVFMVVAFSASGAAWGVIPNVPMADMWPNHQSTTQLQPTVEVGVQTLTLTFSGADDSNTVWRLRDGGIISLIGDPGGSGTAQLETLQIGVDGGVVQNGNTIEITFAHSFVEDAYYAVTVSADAIQMVDESFYSGLGYDVAGATGDLFIDADWAFRVDDVTDPVMANCNLGTEIENGDRGVDVLSDTVYVCFSEPLSWVGGANPLAGLERGDIAFYHATNDDLRLPTGEFGGDVLYQKPSDLILSADGMTLKIVLSDPAVAQDMLKSGARHTDVWPVDADIYLRFAAGLLEDKGGNLWAGLTTSPKESYNPDVDTYWFTTRDASGISVDIINVDGVTHATPGHDPIWMNEVFRITLGEEDLRWIDDNDLLNSSGIHDLVELKLDGVDYSYTSSITYGPGYTILYIMPNPDFLPVHSGQTVTVKVLGGLVRDADLAVVPETEATFTLGDFNAPELDASINNVLCTNFDLRAGTNEDGIVYYALIDEDSIGNYWDTPTIADIYRGYNQVYNGSSWENVYFNHVADPDGPGPYYHGVDPNGAVWQADSFNVTPGLTAFEHIDDFVDPNHGKTFRVYYFGVDPAASGPYNTNGIPIDGQATAVSMFTVDLTDCLPPEHAWHYEGVVTVNDPLYDPCSDGENIKKQGKWNFKVPTGGHIDDLQFIDPNLSWNDQAGLIASGVFTLEVSDDDCSNSNATWREVEIESIVYSNDEVIVTPLNSYPSGGCVRITLRSGTFMDASANPINEELSCTKTCETYCDPKITTFTIETKALKFPAAPEFVGLNGVVALKDGEITIEFNNPMFTPERDETNSPVLEPISEDSNDVNWIGNYIKVRVGDENSAEVTDNIVDEHLFNYAVTRSSEDGITKVVMSPKAGELEYESETWYYVEVEQLLQDINRRELAWDDGTDVWHNNTFVDPHHQYTNYPATSMCSTFSTDVTEGNTHNYFMRFRTEDKIAPQLLYAFTLMSDSNPGTIVDTLYYELTDSASVSCTRNNGVGYSYVTGGNGMPIAGLITEWSEMGFDSGSGYYIEDDPNTLRPYFTLRNSAGESLDFDVVVLEIYTPLNPLIVGSDIIPDTVTDAVLFGFRPFEELAEGENYSMSFYPDYQASNPVAPAVGLSEGPVFIDDNGNALEHNTYVEFSTCVTDPNVCFNSTVTIVDGTNDDGFTPDFTVTFDRADAAPVNGQPFFALTDGTDTWNADDETLFSGANGVYTIPWSAFSPQTPLTEDTTYTLTVHAGGFAATGNASILNCEKTFTFTTVDTTPPAIDSLSPDIDWVTVGADVANNLGDAATDISPRVPGKVRMWFNEDVTMIPGKLIKIYHNGTSLRQTFVAGDADNGMIGNMWWGDINEDELYYDGHYHVDVQAGFVEDAAGNPFDNYTGWEDRISVTPGGDGTSTWTFATGSDQPLEYVDFNPGLTSFMIVDTIDPNLPGDAYENLGDGTVRITQLSFKLSEKSVINDGTIPVVIEEDNTYVDVFSIPVSDFTSTDGIIWIANTDFIVDMDREYVWIVNENAFRATDNASDLSPSIDEEYPFLFLDVTPPTAKIWPEDGDTHVAFNTHGYVRFSEPVIADDGMGNTLVVSQQNLKSWIKVTDVVDGPLGPDEYVCEFINPERTHVRITFLDEDAPAIGGSTANLIDEHQYTIDVNVTGDGVGDTGPVSSNGYTLQDQAGNALEQPATVTFTVEDITAPMFDAGMCSTTFNSVDIKFTPKQNVDPHQPTVRTYPAEGGTVYYVVLRSDATPPTAAQLFDGSIAGSTHTTISSGGITVNYQLPESTVATGYDFVIYAVMEDAEVDVYVAPDYGDAWIGDDPIFAAVDYPVGIADIRPAPNKNMDVVSWSFCVCDDDAPLATDKEWNQDLNVPVASSFTISFDELVQLDPNVDITSGTGTGGVTNYAHEVRLRRWDNNVAIPITLSQTDDMLTITPVSDLDEETRYYIEIDREVIMDQYMSNCGDSDGDVCQWAGCANTPNYFAGWVGRNDWWFQTTDNTPPVLTSVAPAGECISEGTNSIVFTFSEKNEMVINALSGTSANIYVYKQDEYAIPFEIIAANSGVIANPGGGSTWTITYTTYHKYNSEETYEVVWDDNLFTDAAIPTQHKYTIGTGDVDDDGGDLGAPWDMFEFTMEDFVAPTVHWQMVSTLWQNYDDGVTIHPEYVYPIANGAGFWDPNDSDPHIPAPVTVNECGDDAVPHKVAFYVWTDEEVNYVDYTNDEDPFFLEMETSPGNWVPISINVDSLGYDVGLFGIGKDLYGNINVNHNWWVISPATAGAELDGSTHYRFGINGGELEDDTECSRTDDLPGQELFNFCTWNTDPAVADLSDGCDNRVTPYDEVVNKNIDRCVCEKEYFTLCFDKIVVKTTQDGAGYPVTVPGAPWFSYANLLMTEADLMDTDDGNYINFTDNHGDPVVIDSVKTFINGVEITTGTHCPTAEGALCYRLYVHGGLDENAVYNFEVKPDVLKDQTRIPNGNIFPGRMWIFETRWFTAPFITSLAPADNSVNVVPDQDLVITFNRSVIAGDGHIVVRDNGTEGQGVVLNVPGTDASVSISGNTVTIAHGGHFSNNTTYYAEVMEDFVRGAECTQLSYEGDIEQGIIDDEWNWTTGDVDGPVATLSPLYTDECVAPVSDLVLTFDENVYFDSDCAELVIYKATSLNADGSPSNTLFGDVVERIDFNETNFPKIRITGTDPANNMTRNVITVVPEEAFESGETYYVRIEGNGVDCDTESDILNDVIGNTWYYPLNSDLPGIHYNDWWFTIAPDDAPVLVSTAPVRGELLDASQLGEGVTTDLVMTFDMNILKGAGTIEVWEFLVDPEGGVPAQQEYKWAEYDVASEDVVVNGNTATISGVDLLDGIHWYYVLATPGTFTSDVSCVLTQWAGITNPDVWLFSTAADTTCPEMTSNAITSGALDPTYLDPSSVAFEVAFTENVSVVNSAAPVASIQLAGTATTVATTEITEAMIADNVITFTVADLSAPLVDQTQYELVILAGAVHDKGTNSLTGTQNPFGQVPVGSENWMCDDIIIPFETGDFTAPVITEFTPTVTCLENENTLVVKFSEPVQDGTGSLTLVDDAGVLADVVLDAANDEDTADSTVTFTVNLPDETNWTVMVDEGFVTDFIYMGVALDGPWDNEPNAAGDWMFGIDDNTVPSLVSWTVADAKDSDIANLDTTFSIILTYDDTITVADIALAQLTVAGNSVNGLVSATIDAADATKVTVEVAGVADQTEYELWLAAGFVADDACNANLSVADTAGTFVVGDRTAPIIEDNAPIGILSTYIDVEAMIDFFDDSALTVRDSIVITNKDNSGVVISEVKWGPFLDGDQKATTMPALWFGTVDVLVPAGTVEDANGNINEEFTWSFSIVDNTPPCLVSVSPEDGETCVLENTELVMNFCDRMDVAANGQMFHVYELNSTGGNTEVAHILVTPEMISLDSTVTITLDATTILASYNGGLGILKDNQDYIVMADEGALRDEAGNEWVGISDPTVWNWTTGDNTNPTVVLVPASSVNDLNNIVVEAQFSEEVVGADTEITVAGAQSFTVTMNATNDVATIEIVALDMDTVVVTVPTTITDTPDCNVNPLAEEVTGTYVVGDNTRPVMSVVEPDEPTNTENTFDVVFTFTDESGGVNGFADALTVNPTAGLVGIAGADGDLVYTVSLAGADETDVVISLDSTKVKDVSINANTLGASGAWTATYTVGDHVAPSVVSVTPEDGDDMEQTFTVDVTFSEGVTNVEDGITINGVAAGSAVVFKEGTTWTVTLTGEDDDVIVLGVTDVVTDDSQNANELSNPGDWTYTIGDNTPPVISYINPETAVDTINEFLVTITFSEEVVLGTDAFTVEGGTIGEITPVYDNQSFQFTVGGEDKAEVVLTVSTGITDVAGNAFAGATYTYTIGTNSAVPIAEVQGTGDASPIVGEFTMIEGTVTGVSEGEGYFVQDANDAWSGIWVQDGDAASKGISLGSGVIVSGDVAEVTGVTTIVATDVQVGMASFVPVAIELTPTAVAAEMYESVLVKVHGARAKAADASTGEWNIFLEDDDNINVNDWLFAYTPVAGYFYDVTGVVNAKYDDFKIEPRIAADIVDLGLNPVGPEFGIEFKVYPNPFANVIKIDNSDKLTRVVVSNIAGQRVIDIEYPNSEIRTDNLVSGIYLISLFTEEGIAKTEKIIKK